LNVSEIGIDFAAANVIDGSLKSKMIPDKQLVRFQFMEIFVRRSFKQVLQNKNLQNLI